MNKAEILYNKYLKELKSQIGNKALNNLDLDILGKHYFGRKYIGTFSQDNVLRFLENKSMFVFNVDTKKMKGSHWVAAYVNNNIVYLYDSFGRTSQNLIPIFIKNLKNMKYVDSDYDVEQKNQEINCGHRCISWLRVVKELGINSALKI